MYRSILCLVWIALAGCVSESEPGGAQGEAQPLSSDDADQAHLPASGAKPVAAPGKPDDRCLAKVKQCYAEGGDDETCQQLEKQCLPPEPARGGCAVSHEAEPKADVPPCPAPPRPVAGAMCVTKKKNCKIDEEGRETCESIESDCTAPPATGVPPDGPGGAAKGCGIPVEPPEPTDGCTHKSVTCTREKDGSEVCKTTVEPCAVGEPGVPEPPEAPRPPS